MGYVDGVNIGPTWVLSAPDGTHVGPMSLAIREKHTKNYNAIYHTNDDFTEKRMESAITSGSSSQWSSKAEGVAMWCHHVPALISPSRPDCLKHVPVRQSGYCRLSENNIQLGLSYFWHHKAMMDFCYAVTQYYMWYGRVIPVIRMKRSHNCRIFIIVIPIPGTGNSITQIRSWETDLWRSSCWNGTPCECNAQFHVRIIMRAPLLSLPAVQTERATQLAAGLLGGSVLCLRLECNDLMMEGVMWIPVLLELIFFTTGKGRVGWAYGILDLKTPELCPGK